MAEGELAQPGMDPMPMKMAASIIGSEMATVMSTSRAYSPTAE
jgi:hypothetical protein